MLGLDDDSGDEEDGKPKGKRKRGADDLDDDFDEEGVPDYDGLGAGLDVGVAHSSDEEGEDEDGSVEDEEEASSEGGSEEEEGDDDDESDDENSEGEEGEHEHLVAPTKATKGKSKGKSAKHELPFTFPCPESHDEFLEIVENIADEDVPIVVQRIRALYHTSLAEDNKFKLQVRIFNLC